MARTKTAKTMVERFGFRDSELSTKAHDEIVMWVEDNAYKVVQGLYPDHTWTKEEVRSFLRRSKAPVEEPESIGLPKRGWLSAVVRYTRSL